MFIGCGVARHGFFDIYNPGKLIGAFSGASFSIEIEKKKGKILKEAAILKIKIIEINGEFLSSRIYKDNMDSDINIDKLNFAFRTLDDIAIIGETVRYKKPIICKVNFIDKTKIDIQYDRKGWLAIVATIPYNPNMINIEPWEVLGRWVKNRKLK